MSDTEYKICNVGEFVAPQIRSGNSLAPNTPMQWAPALANMRAQDSALVGTRRVLFRVGMSGSTTWHVPDGTDPVTTGGPLLYPDETDTRTVGVFTARQTPGTQLICHVTHIGSGAVASSSGGAHFVGSYGRIVLQCVWSNSGGSSSVEYRATLPGSDINTDNGGGEPTSNAGFWSSVRTTEIGPITPSGTFASAAGLAAFQEGTDVQITIVYIGSPRVVDLVIYELPLAYANAHDSGHDVAAHCRPLSTVPVTRGPQETAADGATYTEGRFGTLRQLGVASWQLQNLGPTILCWSSWDESSESWSGDTVSALDVTRTSAGEIQTGEAYDAGPGYSSPGPYGRTAKYAAPLRLEAGIIPVRVSVNASYSGAYSGFVRVQSSDLEWTDVEIDSASDPTVFAYGWLATSPVAALSAAPHVQLLSWVDTGGTLSVSSVVVEFWPGA